MGPISYPETSLANYHSTLRKIPKGAYLLSDASWSSNRRSCNVGGRYGPKLRCSAQIKCIHTTATYHVKPFGSFADETQRRLLSIKQGGVACRHYVTFREELLKMHSTKFVLPVSTNFVLLTQQTYYIKNSLT